MKLLAILTTVASLVALGIFCWLGFAYLAGADGEPTFVIAGSLTLLYGIGGFFVLGAAWLRPVAFLRSLSQWAAAALFVLWVVGSLDSGRVSGLEAWSILGAAFLLFLNVTGVRVVLKSHGAAQSAPADGSVTASRRQSRV